MTLEEWREHVGRRVIFRYFHGEEATGTVTSVGTKFVFVRFGQAHGSEACEPSLLRLEVCV